MDFDLGDWDPAFDAFGAVYQGRVASVSNCDCLEWNNFWWLWAHAARKTYCRLKNEKQETGTKTKKTSFRISFVLVGGGLTTHDLFSSRKLGRRFQFWLICFRWVDEKPSNSWWHQGALAYGAAERLAEAALGVVGGQGWRVFSRSTCKSWVLSFHVWFTNQITKDPAIRIAHLKWRANGNFWSPFWWGILRSRPQMNEFIQSECSGARAARATCTIVHLKIY